MTCKKRSYALQLAIMAGVLFMLTCTCIPGLPGLWAQNSSASAASSAQVSGVTMLPSVTGMTPDQAAAARNLTPAQKGAIAQELEKTGGKLTPGAVDALKGRPEFEGLSPEEVAKGKELIEQAEKKQPDRAADRGPKRTITDLPKGETLFERAQMLGSYQNIPLDLRPFGYDFFREAAIKVITDRKDIPVPLQYVVGPGDEVRIVLWGRVNASYTLTVDRDGKIAIPDIGPLNVAGMTFEEMSGHLTSQAQQITGTNVDITMGALRTIPIFVLGDVRRPGAYTIGALATITDALLLSGGPSEIGTMRTIQLKRSDTIIKQYDLYDLLLKGDKSQDMTLQAGDIVFVPVIGPYAAIAGNVKRPAIYELKDDYTLAHLFDLAGGIIPTAYTQQIQVERTIKNEKKIVVDIDDKNLSRAKGILLQDGDIVKVFPIVEKDVNAVYLQGNVKRGGKYALTPGMRLKDILKSEQELLPDTYFDYALIKRVQPPGMETTLVPFSLEKLLLRNDPKSNLPLEPQDQIFVFSKWFFRDKPYYAVSGEVRQGGRFDLEENTRVKDAILAAGNVTKDAFLEKAELIRVNEKKEYYTIYFNVAEALANNPQENLLVHDQDSIIIHSVWEQVNKEEVYVDGDVKNPGAYLLTQGMTVKDLIFKAGNLLDSAFVGEAEITSLVVDNAQVAKMERKTIDLQKALAGDSAHNIILMPYDRLQVKRIPDWHEAKFASIEGEVTFPGRYSVKKGERLSSLIERAGGYTDLAYARGAVFTRESVRAMQQKSLTEMVERLERELVSQSAVEMSTAVSKEAISATQAELEQKQKFLASLRELKATGRMTVRIGHLRLLKGSEYDILLEDGDRLTIPPRNDVVTVVGSVMTHGSYIYSEDYDYENYIDMAGGYTKFADKKNVFIVKVDGSARKARGDVSWNPFKERWEMTAFGEKIKEIEPGDTIVVPEEIGRIAWLREFKDITQVLMQLAVTAGVVYNMW